jgi:hypothetical protein
MYLTLQCVFPLDLNSGSGFATGRNLLKIPISALKEESLSSPFFLRHSPYFKKQTKNSFSLKNFVGHKTNQRGNAT